MSTSTAELVYLLLTHFTEVFSVPTRQYIRHELTVWLPWFIKRHIFRQKLPKPPAIIATADEVKDVSA